MNYEMIFCIVNAGCTGDVMDAARGAGAGGGTIIHGRGTAAKDAEEYFHITIQPEKDMVMILVPVEIRDNVMHALYKAAGLGTRGQGIAFSVPLNRVVGLKQPEEEKPAEEKDE